MKEGDSLFLIPFFSPCFENLDLQTMSEYNTFMYEINYKYIYIPHTHSNVDILSSVCLLP